MNMALSVKRKYPYVVYATDGIAWRFICACETSALAWIVRDALHGQNGLVAKVEFEDASLPVAA